MEDGLDLVGGWNVREFLECIVGNGIGVERVGGCGYIDLVVMCVEGGWKDFVDWGGEYVV